MLPCNAFEDKFIIIIIIYYYCKISFYFILFYFFVWSWSSLLLILGLPTLVLSYIVFWMAVLERIKKPMIAFMALLFVISGSSTTKIVIKVMWIACLKNFQKGVWSYVDTFECIHWDKIALCHFHPNYIALYPHSQTN